MGVKEGNIIAQLATIKYEMNGEFIDCKNRLMATAGVDDATRIIFSEYEGPNDTSLEARKNWQGKLGMFSMRQAVSLSKVYDRSVSLCIKNVIFYVCLF